MPAHLNIISYLVFHKDHGYDIRMIVAEIGTSHKGSKQRCEQLIKAAVQSGADAVKLQWVYADEILHPDTGFVDLPGGKIRLYDRFKQLEVPSSFYKDAKDFAHSLGVKFICSPFGLKSLEELLDIAPDAVKIASPELNHFPMLKALAAFRDRQKLEGRPPIQVILSSGVSKIADIEKALCILGTENLVLLHCITSYPAPESEYNVKVLSSLRRIFGVPTGISDHSIDPILVPSLAAAMGGVMTEKHITLSKKDDGLDDPVALESEQFALMVHAVHQSQAAVNRYGMEIARQKIISQLSEQYNAKMIAEIVGNGIKRLAPAEEKNYGRTNRSLHFMDSMKKGSRISQKDIGVLRTEKVLSPGISPEFLDTVIGARLSKDVSAGSGVQWEDLLTR